MAAYVFIAFFLQTPHSVQDACATRRNVCIGNDLHAPGSSARIFWAGWTVH